MLKVMICTLMRNLRGRRRAEKESPKKFERRVRQEFPFCHRAKRC